MNENRSLAGHENCITLQQVLIYRDDSNKAGIHVVNWYQE